MASATNRRSSTVLRTWNPWCRALVDARPDAIQMNYGQADLLQDLPGKDKPALVMRIDMGNPV